MEQAIEASHFEKFNVGAGDVEYAGALHVDAGGGGGGKSTVAELYKLGAALVAGAGVGENFLGLEIESASAWRESRGCLQDGRARHNRNSFHFCRG